MAEADFNHHRRRRRGDHRDNPSVTTDEPKPARQHHDRADEEEVVAMLIAVAGTHERTGVSTTALAAAWPTGQPVILTRLKHHLPPALSEREGQDKINL
ncbi:hypothetical protein [Nocardia sp. CC227C]|uniref:hypothetical protein n=1 Tax=Nocardia sp. CC227C TaxID=3044562 RepID=UPI00278C1A39|nr:hypothetical protein [Nocardia sp. CC227C]